MKIEIWSDFVCPFCYIGTRRLEEALSTFPEREHITLEFKCFQLDPHAPLYDGQDYYESLAEKFGSIERAKQMNENVQKMAEQVGLTFHFDTAKPTNTYTAHRLVKYAEKHGKNVALTKRLFQAHFTDGEDIGNFDVLTKLTEDVGLPKEDVKTVLSDETKYADDVQHDFNEARQFNITGVPFFIFDRKRAISGAQEVDMFSQALKVAWEDTSE